jgi:hypothetical protein
VSWGKNSTAGGAKCFYGRFGVSRWKPKRAGFDMVHEKSKLRLSDLTAS